VEGKLLLSQGCHFINLDQPTANRGLNQLGNT